MNTNKMFFYLNAGCIVINGFQILGGYATPITYLALALNGLAVYLLRSYA